MRWTERERERPDGWEGVFSIAPVERREWKGGEREEKERENRRGKETGRGERGIYSGTGFLSAVRLTMLCKAKVVANFQIRYVYVYDICIMTKKL